MNTNIIKNKFLFDDVKFIPYNNNCIIMLFSHYFPAKKADLGNINISNYYISSQKAYLKTIEVIKFLNVNGINAKMFKEEKIKELCAQSGGYFGKNTLYIHETLGSFVNIQAIAADMKISVEKSEKKTCKNCGLCTGVCTAISQEGFFREKCLRQRLDYAIDNKETCEGIYQLMGCEKCQIVCPHNNTKFEEGVSLSINDILMLNNFDTIKRLIGKNIAKKNNILNQTIIYAANTMYKDAKDIILTLKEDENFKWACEYYLQKINNVVY